MGYMQGKGRSLKEGERRKEQASRYPCQFKLLRRIFLHKSLRRGMSFYCTYLQLNFYVQILPHILVCDRGAAKSNNEKMLIVVR